jgi:hypothetical integral membrane protein (TIGR02206 family)
VAGEAALASGSWLWPDRFEMFSAFHGVVVAVCVGTIALACVLGRRGYGGRTERAVRRWIAAGSFLLYAVYVGYWMMPGRFEWRASLPLHVCDLMAAVAVLAMWVDGARGNSPGDRSRRWPHALLYFGGLGLCTQGFITPVVTSGPASGHFWLFWWLHLWIVGAAVYDLVVRGFRPGWRDLGTTIAIGVVYVVSMVGLNLLIEANYGYVGPSRPSVPTLVDKLGPWPGRVLILSVMTIVLMTGMLLPWVGWAGRKARRGSGQYTERA